MAREVRDAETVVTPPDPGWVARAVRAGGAVAGTAITSARILDTAAAKAAARRNLPENEPATVDLESAAFARAAAGRGIPYVIVRAVCDTLNDPLPLDLDACRDDSGSIRRLEVVRRALMQPSSVRELWRLRRRLASCADQLASVIETLLAPGEFP